MIINDKPHAIQSLAPLPIRQETKEYYTCVMQEIAQTIFDLKKMDHVNDSKADISMAKDRFKEAISKIFVLDSNTGKRELHWLFSNDKPVYQELIEMVSGVTSANITHSMVLRLLSQEMSIQPSNIRQVDYSVVWHAFHGNCHEFDDYEKVKAIEFQFVNNVLSNGFTPKIFGRLFEISYSLTLRTVFESDWLIESDLKKESPELSSGLKCALLEKFIKYALLSYYDPELVAQIATSEPSGNYWKMSLQKTFQHCYHYPDLGEQMIQVIALLPCDLGAEKVFSKELDRVLNERGLSRVLFDLYYPEMRTKRLLDWNRLADT